MKLIECNESHSESILMILNDVIVNSTALYDYQPRTSEMMLAWFTAKRQGKFPILGAVSDDGNIMGFASYGPFRAWPAYKYTVEHSVYIAERYRRRGLGSILLKAMIDRATEQDYHALIGGIDSTNVASIALHEQLGFQHSATLRQVGFKFGRWLDLSFYQLILSTPHEPVDG